MNTKLTSHTEVIDEPYKAPTCKEAGHEKKSHCSVCDAVLSDGKEIPKIAHTLVKDAAVALELAAWTQYTIQTAVQTNSLTVRWQNMHRQSVMVVHISM